MAIRVAAETLIGSGFTPTLVDDRPIRVLIVDDHPAICEALRYALDTQKDMECCGVAHTADVARELFRSLGPDVAVIDLSLSDAYGLSLVSEIREQMPHVQIVIYSMSKEAVYAERAIRTGALGYVSKTDSTQTVLEAVRTVFAGKVYLNKRVALRLLSHIIRGDGHHQPKNEFDRLTNQEMAVVHLLGMGHTVEKVAEVLKLNSRTVQAYQRRAKEKLGYQTTGELLMHAMEWTQS